MIKEIKFLYFAFILFILSMVLNFPFPDENPFGLTVTSVLNIPVSTTNGLNYIGITSLVLLITGLYFLAKSLKKFHGRMILLAIILAIYLPVFLTNSFQKTIATGIYAISYDHDKSNCHFKMANETTLHGVCDLPFENYSRKDVQFTVEFYEKNLFEDDAPMVSLMNEDAPYKVRIKGKESKQVRIVVNIDVSQMKSHIDSGEATLINIIIKSGKRSRKL